MGGFTQASKFEMILLFISRMPVAEKGLDAEGEIESFES
jgi:hypothetical protein